MIRESIEPGTKVYCGTLGLFGKITGKIHLSDINFREVEFDDFFQYYHRKDLTEIEE